MQHEKPELFCLWGEVRNTSCGVALETGVVPILTRMSLTLRIAHEAAGPAGAERREGHIAKRYVRGGERQYVREEICKISLSSHIWLCCLVA